MSIHDEEAPPVIMPPVRRDPTLGWNDDGMRPIDTEPDSYIRGMKLGVRAALIVLAVGALGVLLIVVAGVTAHALLRAIMFGWRHG